MAALLSLVMVCSMVPNTGMMAYAEDEDTSSESGWVTVTVTDSSTNEPIEGASVAYTVYSGTAELASDTKQTDAKGVVQVINLSGEYDNVSSYTLTATITADGYDSAEISETIQSKTDNYDVQLTKTTPATPSIEGVTVEGVEATYTGKEIEAVKVSGTKRNDTVTYQLGDGESTDKVPTVTDAGTYSVTVTVQRDGYTDLEKTVTTTINKADISGLSIAAKTLTYNEDQQELVELTGSFGDSDTVTWTVNGEATEGKDVPTAMAVGNYTVTLTVNRGSNYNEFSQTVTASIGNATLNLGNLTVAGLESTYDGTAKKAVTVENQGDYTLMYQLDEGDQTVDEDAWQSTIPTVTNAGSYIVWVKAVKEGYDDKEVTVTPAESAVTPYNVYVAQAKQALSFEEGYEENGTTNVTFQQDDSERTYSFAVEYKAHVDDSESTVTYEISAAACADESTDTLVISGDGTTVSFLDNTLIAEIISTTGQIKVYNCNFEGAITVTATLSGTDNYSEKSISHTLAVGLTGTSDKSYVGSFISFEDVRDTDGVVAYTLGTNTTVTDAKATKNKNITWGSIKSYSIALNGKDLTNDLNQYGLQFNTNNGTLTVNSYDKLATALDQAENGTLTFTISATYQRDGFFGIGAASETVSYTVTISFAETPEEAYTLSEATGDNDWYTGEVTVTPADGYTIAKSADGPFGNTVTFGDENDQGTDTRYVYLKDATGGITNKIAVDVKIDTKAPGDVTITYQELNLIQKVGVALGFYNPNITINFAASDATSGIDRFEWAYTRADDASTSNLSAASGTLTDLEEQDGTATATLTLPVSEADQLRGNISVTAYDKAGNSTARSDTDTYTFVVDTISPTCSVEYTEQVNTEQVNEVDKQLYYDGDVDFKITVTEINFYSEDVVVTVSTDGGEAEDVLVSWSDVEGTDEHLGTFTLSGDGDYVVYITYTDRSSNEMASYTSPGMTIDTIDPVVDITYDRESQSTTFTVTEHNFRSEDVAITGTMQDINGNDVDFTAEELTAILQAATWEQDKENSDVHTCTIADEYVNGIYDLAFNYTDLANRSAVEATYQFIIDHDAPTDVRIEVVTDPVQTLLRVITFGFYNPSVTVRFTAYDDASGVASFTWSYTKENGASDVNRDTDQETTTVEAVQDSSDKSKFTAEVTLPNTSASQLRGYLAVYATDNFDNSSETLTDSGNILVVDTIAPEITVAYNTPSRTVGSKSYYNGNINVTLTVNEANFYSEDVVVKVSKNGGTATAVTPTWKDKSVDIHVGTFTLKNDGHYIITVEYTDKSGNSATVYTSNQLTIDTIKPVISVTYKNTAVANTLTDSENHTRDYYGSTQTAVVTITEHNFNASEVDFTIVAKDVAGNTLNASNLYRMSSWSVDSTGDVHTITITYPGDANYTFDVAYTDLATNQAADYAEDYFTVDTTAPTNLTVSYSTSVLDTVLQSLTFGFYNAKMTVTISATDDISGVYSFLYSYVNAAGVRSVNAQLINEAIAAAGITYSNGGRTATATFTIPKMVLGNNNQFNGTVEFTATDRADNESQKHSETKRVVVDNIAPNATVTYNNPVNTVGSTNYFDGSINVTVTINEANFYSGDVQVSVTKDGASYTVSPVWSDSSTDVHVGTFTLSEDGEYTVSVNYTDKSSNAMQAYTSQLMIIDTDISTPTFTINGEAKEEVGGAYKNDVDVSFQFEDQNFASYTISLVRTRFDSVEDVTEAFITVDETENGGYGSFSIPSEVANDGIYVLTVSITDQAGHTTESYTKFTVNRYGSVYEYGDYLVSLIQNGGQYITISGGSTYAVTEDLVITEFNADPILDGSLLILITRDGESIDVDYTVTQVSVGGTDEGEEGWYQYVYTISASNFAEDGVYKITLASAYSTSDSDSNDSTSVPENSIDSNGEQILDTMTFTVDTTPPEIRNIVNLEEAIVNAQSLDVSFTVVDVGGLKSIEVIVNGETVDTITEFGDSVYSYSGQFTINESAAAQTVRLVATDLAGNVTDTSAESFSTNDLYVFNDTVTVSTNFFVRWYANAPLFWGSIIGVILLIAIIWFIILWKRKKDEEEKQNGNGTQA